VRSILFQWDEVPSDFLDLEGAIEIPRESALAAGVSGGELLLATFTVSLRATAVTGRVERVGETWLLRLETRDWERLVTFAQKVRMPPSSRSPAHYDSVRDIRLPSRFPSAPIAAGGDAMFLRVVFVRPGPTEREDFVRELGGSGIIVDLCDDLEVGLARLHVGKPDALLLTVSEGLPELPWLSRVRSELPELVIVCTGDALPARDIVTTFEKGADEFATKPLRASEFGARLVALMRRRRGRETNLGVA
jgi:CheY-like chemotaxis protein